MSYRTPKPKQITDHDILWWIKGGLLVIVDPHLPDPRLFFRGVEIKAYLNEQGGSNRNSGNKRYRFKLRWRGKERKIVRSKLVWMFCKKEVVAEGYKIHHGPASSLNDSIQNLDKMTDAEHQAHHYGPANEDPF